MLQPDFHYTAFVRVIAFSSKEVLTVQFSKGKLENPNTVNIFSLVDNDYSME